MEAKLKHLEFVQDNINRMARNSFLLKGWAITIVSGLLVVSSKNATFAYALISLAALALFWLSDSYYLYQERLFIKLYDYVRHLPEEKIDFSMKTDSYKSEVSQFKCFSSDTMCLFYGGLFIVQIVIILTI